MIFVIIGIVFLLLLLSGQLRGLFVGMILLGFIGWPTFLFAGSGFAFLICTGLVIIGILGLLLSNLSK